MITRKEAFAEIKKLLGLKFDIVAPAAQAAPAPAPAPTPAATAPADYPLADGRILTIDTLAVGGVVTIAGVPAPDAEYVLADGTSITTLGGIISEVETPAAAATEPVVAAAAPLTTPAQMQEALQKFADTATTPDMQKITVILKAVFENVFGWQLREAQEQATRAAAIQAYQTGFASAKADSDLGKAEVVSLKKENENLKIIITKMVEQVETIGEGLVEKPLEDIDEGKLTAFQKHQLKDTRTYAV